MLKAKRNQIRASLQSFCAIGDLVGWNRSIGLNRCCGCFGFQVMGRIKLFDERMASLARPPIQQDWPSFHRIKLFDERMASLAESEDALAAFAPRHVHG